MGELRSDHQRDSETEVGRLPPADVRVGGRRGVEGNEAVAGRASVVGHDGGVPVERLVELVDHAVVAERLVVAREQWAPLVQPFRAGGTDPCLYIGAVWPVTEARSHLVDESSQGEADIAHQPDVDVLVLSDLVGVVGVLDQRRPSRDALAIWRAGQAGPESEEAVGLTEPLRGGTGRCHAARADRQRVILGERRLALHRAEDRHCCKLGQLA